MNKCCRTCLFSTWSLTPTGRIRATYGRCLAPIPTVEELKKHLPACVIIDPPHKCVIWPEEGCNCPAYVANKGKPKPE